MQDIVILILLSLGISISAKAEFNLDQDPALDTWTINEQKVLDNTINDLYGRNRIYHLKLQFY